MAPPTRNGSTRRWRELRARKIRDALRRAPDGVLTCEVGGCGPLDPDARPGSRYAVDVDHIVPVASGGSLYPNLEGLRITCPRCNRSAGGAMSSGRHGQREVMKVDPWSAHGYHDDAGLWNRTTRAW